MKLTRTAVIVWWAVVICVGIIFFVSIFYDSKVSKSIYMVSDISFSLIGGESPEVFLSRVTNEAFNRLKEADEVTIYYTGTENDGITQARVVSRFKGIKR